LGAIITYFLTFVQSLETMLVPFAAGGFIYIAATDLMPELHKKSRAGTSVVQLLALILGIALMAYLKMVMEA
ncbi:MAG: ZIP family metal transporter, partial [Candidatus Bathyarchaeia archaeon]